MRAVIVHNYYRSDQPSGENTSVRAEVEGLRQAGVEVALFSAASDDIGGPLSKLRAGGSCLGSPSVAKEFGALLDGFAPDVVHLENLYPLISPLPAVLARRKGVPVVCSVRNFRFTCAAGTHVRNGEDCFVCPAHPRSLNLPAVVCGCYRGRRIESLPIASAMSVYHRLLANLDHYLPISAYMRDYLVETVGVGEDRITVRPNAGPMDQASPTPIASRRVLFAARFTPEKGVMHLLEAWRAAAPESGWVLAIAGAGPLDEAVRSKAQTIAGVEYLGHLSPSELGAEYERAAFVVIPSMWKEPFGRTAIEAFAHGRPVLACAIGALASVVDQGCGVVVDPGVEGLTSGLRSMIGLDDECRQKMGTVAADRYNALYTPRANIAVLTDVYRRVSSRKPSGPVRARVR